MNRKYSGFTLVEMLIVMGIIIILMVVGITAGRFAINRANDVAHRNAVDQITVSLRAYYTDEREYPYATRCGTGGAVPCTINGLIGSQTAPGYLVPYIDLGAFDGGSKSSYIYQVGGDGGNQSFLVCVTLRGIDSDMFTVPPRSDAEVYCNGTGLGDSTIFGGNVTQKQITPTSPSAAAWTALSGATWADWDKGWLVTP